MTQVFASWSGGKDCCLSVQKVMAKGIKVRYLTNMVTQDAERSCSHGMVSWVIKLQSEALGIPVVQKPTTHETYESIFTETLKGFRKEGITGGVFGDIDFNPHREWIERICNNSGMTPYLPLWLMEQKAIMKEFIGLGFKAVVVAALCDFFDEGILGREIDLNFLDYLEDRSKANNKPITPCGEAGEYHTIVIDGPIFKKRVQLLETAKMMRDNHWFLDILKADLQAK